MDRETEQLLKKTERTAREMRKRLATIQRQLRIANKTLDDYEAFLYPQGRPDKLPGETKE